jgi:hypothetical protein
LLLAAEIRPRSRSTVIGISELPIYPTFSSKEVPSVWRLNIGRSIQGRVSQGLAISAFRPSRLQHAKSSSVISRDAKCREHPGTRAHRSAEKIRAVLQQRHVARDPAESGIGELKVPRTWQQESRYPDTRFPDGAEDYSEVQVAGYRESGGCVLVDIANAETPMGGVWLRSRGDRSYGSCFSR